MKTAQDAAVWLRDEADRYTERANAAHEFRTEYSYREEQRLRAAATTLRLAAESIDREVRATSRSPKGAST